jgi:uncharacterized membrane protein
MRVARKSRSCPVCPGGARDFQNHSHSMSLSTAAGPAGTETSTGAMRFGRVSASAAGGHASVRWVLERHCSMNPAQLKVSFALLAAISLAVSGAASALGATLALPFAGLELALVAWAMAVHCRHARDCEAIELAAGTLTVERRDGANVERLEFNGAWTRVEPTCGDCALIGICGQGRRVEVGRFVRPELRPQLANELCRALRGHPGHGKA